MEQHYEVGKRVRLTCPCYGAQPGEEGRIVQVKRDGQGQVVSLDVLLDGSSEKTRGISVYPREIELVNEHQV